MPRSGKKWDQVLPIDRAIRQACPAGMFATETRLTIRYVTGFELFGAYETWSSGYYVEGQGVKASAADLDTAILEWAQRLAKEKAARPYIPKTATEIVGGDSTGADAENGLPKKTPEGLQGEEK